VSLPGAPFSTIRPAPRYAVHVGARVPHVALDGARGQSSTVDAADAELDLPSHVLLPLNVPRLHLSPSDDMGLGTRLCRADEPLRAEWGYVDERLLVEAEIADDLADGGRLQEAVTGESGGIEEVR
jgi:hypothetical protein